MVKDRVQPVLKPKDPGIFRDDLHLLLEVIVEGPGVSETGIRKPFHEVCQRHRWRDCLFEITLEMERAAQPVDWVPDHGERLIDKTGREEHI